MNKLIAVEVYFRDRRLKEHVFDQDRVTIGRDPSSDIHLDNAGISRLHATLERQVDGVLIADCGSSNGSLVNLMRVKEAKLQPSDNVQIGKFVLRVTERQDTRGGSGRDSDVPQFPERETIRVDSTRPQSLQDHAAMSPQPTPAKSGSGALLCALFCGGVLLGWLLSLL